MTKLTALITSGLLCLVFVPAASAADDDNAALRVTLDKTYTEWRSALLARNLAAWRTCTTTYRQVLTYNLVTSQKQRYPDAVFDLPVTPPDVLKLKLLEIEAVGETAHLIYFGKMDLGLGDDSSAIPENLLVLKFFKEKDGWKFDSTKFINLADNPEMRESCQRGNPEFLKHPPFNPPGKAPAVPKVCKVPEKVAALRIQAFGYEVLANVNGYDGTPVVDTAEQQLIIGGLARGDNDVRLEVKTLPIPEGEERYLEVEAVLLTGDEKKPTVRVFDWLPKESVVPPVVNLKVVVNNLTMKGI
jgi:hypothetical protein